MIESLCCMLLMIIARITAGIYESKFSFLTYLLKPLSIAAIFFAAVAVIFAIVNIVKRIRSRSRGRK